MVEEEPTVDAELRRQPYPTRAVLLVPPVLANRDLGDVQAQPLAGA